MYDLEVVNWIANIKCLFRAFSVNMKTVAKTDEKLGNLYFNVHVLQKTNCDQVLSLVHVHARPCLIKPLVLHLNDTVYVSGCLNADMFVQVPTLNSKRNSKTSPLLRVPFHGLCFLCE